MATLATVTDARDVLGLDTLTEVERTRWTPLAPFSICRETRQGIVGYSVQDMRTSRRVRVGTKREATAVAKMIEASFYGK